MRRNPESTVVGLWVMIAGLIQTFAWWDMDFPHMA